MLSADADFDSFILTEKTGWKTRVRKAPGITSTSIQNVNHALKSALEERERFYKTTGEKIFRPRLVNDSAVTLSTLGGFREVGRSSMIVKTPESKLLLDCGVHPGTRNSVGAYPRLD
ncbi:MAG: beta-CASP ribonuclease aCPSF1, partial [Nitrososphaerales archaeon]